MTWSSRSPPPPRAAPSPLVAGHRSPRRDRTCASLLLGSEGTFGVITEVTVRVRPRPETVIDEAWAFAGFDSGIAALRALAQDGRQLTSVVRLSDETETSVLALTGGGRPIPGCLMVTSYEGARAAAQAQRAAAAPILAARRRDHARAAAGRRLARRPVHRALPARCAARRRGARRDPGNGDHMGELARGSTRPCGRRLPVHSPPRARRRWSCAMSRTSTPPGHRSTTRSSARSDPIPSPGGRPRRPQRVTRSPRLVAQSPITTRSAPTTARWMRAEIGDLGLDVLRAVAGTLDPGGVLNPGKLIPPR